LIKTDITGRKFEVDEKMSEYIEDKLGGLDKYLPRHARSSAYLEVVLIDDPSGREDNRYVCDVLLNLPGGNLHSAEGAVNMYASIDIVAAKLRAQLHTYKAKHTTEPRRSKMLSRLMGRTSETDPATPAATDGLE
jgi:putative sigma-54 modulation protein